MSAWAVRQWQLGRERIAVGVIVVGAIANVAILTTAVLGALYVIGRSVGQVCGRLG